MKSFRVAKRYARALLDACTKDGCATCKLAAAVCSELNALFSTNPPLARRIVKDTGLPTEFIPDCQRGVDAYMVRVAWKEILRKYHTDEGIRTAASGMEQLLATYDSHGAAMVDNNLSKPFLARESGVAYLRYADKVLAGESEGSSQDARTALLKARSLLDSAKGRGNAREQQKVRQGLSLTDARLKGLDRAPAAKAPPS